MSSNNNIVTDHSIIAITKVERVEDNMGGGRIKVRISPYDIVYKTDDDLPYCFPLLPKLVHVYPTHIFICPNYLPRLFFQKKLYS